MSHEIAYDYVFINIYLYIYNIFIFIFLLENKKVKDGFQIHRPRGNSQGPHRGLQCYQHHTEFWDRGHLGELDVPWLQAVLGKQPASLSTTWVWP